MSVPQPGRGQTRPLELLMAQVRPEFRGEVFRPPADSPVFACGVCRVPSCPTAATFPVNGLCDSHYRFWAQDGRPDLREWAEAGDRIQGWGPACAVTECNRAACTHGLCHRHAVRRSAQGSPDLETWLTTFTYEPPPKPEHDCRYPGCPHWADGPKTPLCRRHYPIWRTRGRPPLEQWFAEVAEHGKNPKVDLRLLGRQLRLEIQFGLQRRHDEGRKPTTPRAVNLAVGRLVNARVSSLLDWDEPQWRSFWQAPGTGDRSRALSFVLDARFHLENLLLGADPWTLLYLQDTWDLRHLGIISQNARFLRFADIPQPWLRDLLKRWCRWRLTSGTAPATVAYYLMACRHFAEHLRKTCGPHDDPQELTRARVESWFATLQHHRPHPVTRRRYIGSLSAFLKDVHRHDWEPGLPRNAFVFNDDAPARPPSKPRWIPEPIMRQMEDPAKLAAFPTDDGRTLLQIIIQCGLRLKDARQLPFDCITRDDSGAPYLAWINHKIEGRIAFFPIAEALQQLIQEQHQRVLSRFPEGCRWLFPGAQTNLDGSRPMSDQIFREHLDLWLERISLADEHGRPTRVTAHRFRHTLGTRLINANVPQHVVQQLLDHMSPQMTAVYARLHDKTVREHWEKALKVNSDGQAVTLEADHPLADAAWTKLSMVRAKVTLPNGYCGAPIQTDCEYANPCLDCRFFITTPDFLAQHHRQRDETQRLISDADTNGLARIAEKNTRTLGKLDRLINTLEQAGPNQIVAGGKVTDLNATG